MDSNIHIISEFPDKHHTEIRWSGHYCIMYYINNSFIFEFYPGDCVNFLKHELFDKINEILELKPDFYSTSPYTMVHSMKINNFEKIKELINNHTLTYEERIAFKDFIIEPEFKLKFVD